MQRRDFMGAMAAAAGAAPAAWLAACRARAPLTKGLEPSLNLYMWSDYLGETTLADFERETGVRVTLDTYESNEEMIAKLTSGARGYDLVVPSDSNVALMHGAGLLQPFDGSRVPGLASLAPEVADLPGSADHPIGIPYAWGLGGLAYRADLVREPPTSWGIFQQQELAGQMTMLDDGREVIGAMLKWRGHSLNSTDPGELAQARTDAIAARRNLAAYMSATVKGPLAAGDVRVAQLWSGDTLQAARENPSIRFTVPVEGGLLFTDYLALVAGAPHPAAAHAFAAFVLRPETASAIARATGYFPPVTGAEVPPGIARPSPEVRARLERQHDLGAATATYDRIWTEIKSA